MGFGGFVMFFDFPPYELMAGDSSSINIDMESPGVGDFNEAKQAEKEIPFAFNRDSDIIPVLHEKDKNILGIPFQFAVNPDLLNGIFFGNSFVENLDLNILSSRSVFFFNDGEFLLWVNKCDLLGKFVCSDKPATTDCPCQNKIAARHHFI